MSFFDKIQKGRVRKPLFCALYSGPGVGKSTFAESFPDPCYFDFEESTHMLNVSRHRPETYIELIDDLMDIFERDKITEFKSIIFDTIDEMERLIHWHIAKLKNKTSILDVGWQKGFEYAVDYWAKFINLCRAIRDKHGIVFLFLAHAQTKTINSPDLESTYTKNVMSMHPKAAAYLFGQVEMVLFAEKEKSIKVVNEQSYVVDLDSRIIHTTLNASFDAKNRIGLPKKIPFPAKDAYQILMAAYDKAYNETSDGLYKECLALIKQLEESERQGAKDYCDQYKDNKAVLRILIPKLKAKTGDQKDEQQTKN